jgi:hypothetical protein
LAKTVSTALPILSGRFLVQMTAETNGCELFCISLLASNVAFGILAGGLGNFRFCQVAGDTWASLNQAEVDGCILWYDFIALLDYS